MGHVAAGRGQRPSTGTSTPPPPWCCDAAGRRDPRPGGAGAHRAVRGGRRHGRPRSARAAGRPALRPAWWRAERGMSMPEAVFHQPRSVPLPRRAVAYAAVGAARLLATQPPRRIRAVLGHLRRGAAPATFAQAKAARDTVVAVSLPLRGPGGLPAPFAGHRAALPAGRPVADLVRRGPAAAAVRAPTPGWRPRAGHGGGGLPARLLPHLLHRPLIHDRPASPRRRRRTAGRRLPAPARPPGRPGGCCSHTSVPTAGRCSAEGCSASSAAWPRSPSPWSPSRWWTPSAPSARCSARSRC